MNEDEFLTNLESILSSSLSSEIHFDADAAIAKTDTIKMTKNALSIESSSDPMTGDPSLKSQEMRYSFSSTIYWTEGNSDISDFIFCC